MTMNDLQILAGAYGFSLETDFEGQIVLYTGLIELKNGKLAKFGSDGRDLVHA